MKIILVFFFGCGICFGFSVKSLQEIHNQNIVRQKYEESCGAAALASLLNLFGVRQYQEEEILQQLNQKTDMLSFQELQSVATALGYDTRGFRLTREILAQTSYPPAC